MYNRFSITYSFEDKSECGSSFPCIAPYGAWHCWNKREWTHKWALLVHITKPLAHPLPCFGLFQVALPETVHADCGQFTDPQTHTPVFCNILSKQMSTGSLMVMEWCKFSSAEELLHRRNKSVHFHLVSLIYTHSNSFPTILSYCTFHSFSLLHIICQLWLPSCYYSIQTQQIQDTSNAK